MNADIFFFFLKENGSGNFPETVGFFLKDKCKTENAE